MQSNIFSTLLWATAFASLVGCRTSSPGSETKDLVPSVQSGSTVWYTFSASCNEPIAEPRALVVEPGLTKCWSPYSGNPPSLISYVPAGQQMSVADLAKEVIDKECEGNNQNFGVTCEADAAANPQTYNFSSLTPTWTHVVTLEDVFPSTPTACAGGQPFFPPGVVPPTDACQVKWTNFEGKSMSASVISPAVGGAGWGVCEAKSYLYKMMAAHGAGFSNARAACYSLKNN